MIPGQKLVSDSENDRSFSRRRQLMYDPMSGMLGQPENTGNVLTGARDLVTNAVFNTIDSALFNIPSNLMNRNISYDNTASIWEDRSGSYGEGFDALGIKPFEDLSGAGRFGYGLGQALGFFVPYSGQMKLAKGAYKLTGINNAGRIISKQVDDVIGSTIKNGIPGTASSNPLRSVIKNELGKHRDTIATVYRSSPDQYNRFNRSLTANLQKTILEEAPDIGRRQAENIANTIVGRLQKTGQEGRFVTDIGELIAQTGISVGNNTFSRNLAGWTGRTVDQSINLFAYETAGHIARASMGAQYEDIDYDALESLKHNAGFAAVLSTVDFIPGGRRAGMFQDFFRMARAGLSKRRDFSKMVADGKLTDKQLNVITAWFGKQGNVMRNGKTISDIEINAMSMKDKAAWLDKLYSDNKRDLIRALLRDGGRSLVGSLPRAVFDGIATAWYMNGTENFMTALNDESMIADYLVGGFMAMRLHQPLDPTGRNVTAGLGGRERMAYRYNSSIDARLSLLEGMGADVDALRKSVPAMSQIMVDMNFSAKNLETALEGSGLYEAVFKPRGVPSESDGEVMINSAERELADKIVKILMPSFLERNNVGMSESATEYLQSQFDNGNIPNVGRMSNQQFGEFWNDIKDIEITGGKSISEYTQLGFNRLKEDFERPIANNHIGIMMRHLNEAADVLGIRLASTSEGNIRVSDFGEYTGNDSIDFFLDRIIDLQKTGRAEIVPSGNGAASIREKLNSPEVARQLDQIAKNYIEESSSSFGGGQQLSRVDNPVISYIKEYGNLVQSNRLEDVLRNNIRENDADAESMRRAMMDVLGDSVPSGGFRISTKGLTDQQKAQLGKFQSLLDELYNLKATVGKTRMSKTETVIPYDKAKQLFDFFNKRGIIDFNNDGDLLIAGASALNFRQSIMQNMMSNTNLDHASYILYASMRNKFGLTGDKLNLPSLNVFKSILEREIREEAGTSDYTPESAMRELEDAYTAYKDMYEEFYNAGLVREVENFESDGQTATDMSRFIRDVYSQRAGSELKDVYARFKEKASGMRELLLKFDTLSKEHMNGNTSGETLRKFFLENIDSIRDANEYLGFDAEFGKSLDMIEQFVQSEAGTFDTRPLMNRIFTGDFMDKLSNVYDLNRQISSLANIDKSSTGYTLGYARMRSMMVENWGREAEEISRLNLAEAVEIFIKDKGYDTARELLNVMQKSINVDYGIDANKYIGEASTREMLDALSKLSQHGHRANVQSLMTRFSKLGMVDMVDNNGTKFSDHFIQMMQDGTNIEGNITKILNAIESVVGKDEFNANANDIANELISAIGTLNRRNKAYETVRLQNNTFVRSKKEKTVETPLGEFAETLTTNGIRAVIIKDVIITANGQERLTTAKSLADAQGKINQVVNEFHKDKAGNISKRDVDIDDLVMDKNDNQIVNPTFVPLQANDDVGILVSKTPESVKKIREEFKAFDDRIMSDPNISREHKESWRKHKQSIDKNLGVDGKAPTDMGIASAIRAMYYHDNISRSMFWDMVGTDPLSSMKGQLKNFKYIHHVNSKNAVSFDSKTLGMMFDAMTAIKDNTEVTYSKNVENELFRRSMSDNPLRVFVYNDEAVDARGNRVKGTTAYDIIESTILKKAERYGISYTADQLERKILDTSREYGIADDIESLKQSLLDGASFGRRAAMELDMMLMGESFNDGATAAKTQFHSADGSFIAKHALRFEPTLEKFMADNEIDYIIPASSAKSWEGKDNINQVSQWNPSESIGKNITDNFQGKISEGSVRHFPAETIKYMFPAHSGNRASNTTTSAMHFMDESALNAYSNQLQIDRVVQFVRQKVQDSYSKMFTGGIEGFFSREYDETGVVFSHYSATEQLLRWGLDSQNGFIRDAIMRMVRDTTYGSLLSKPRHDVVNTFLFGDSNLDSAVYRNAEDGMSGTVQSFGQVRVPYSKRKVAMDADASFIFAVVNDGDFQDVVFNRDANGNVRMHSPDGVSHNSIDQNNKSDLDVISNYLYSREDYGDAHTALGDINRFLAGTETIFDVLAVDDTGGLHIVNDKAMAQALSNLRDAGVRDLAIAVNSHKIPKKYMSDSIVNRMEGFVDVTKGNIIEANNYEIALHHQADQDGDKMVAYMKMPFEVLRTSSNNMSVTKDVVTVPPEGSVPFPNIFGSLSDRGSYVDNLTESAVNNPLKYMATERKSKFVVGSTVKLQGATTMFNLAGMQFEGKPIMHFSNNENANFKNLANFSRTIGNITQSILDAWRGVDPGLLNQRAVKDYLLFGDDIGSGDGSIASKIRLMGENGSEDGKWNGIFQPSAEWASKTSLKGRVYRDYVREIYKSFEDVYSIFGDTYEGGVSNKPEYHQMARSYYNLRSLFNNNSNHVYNKLMYRYKKQGRTDMINGLKSMYRENPDSKTNTTLRNVFTFNKSFEDMEKQHPQLRALSEVVKMGDLMKSDDFVLRENDYMKVLFNYSEDGIAAKMASMKDEEIISHLFEVQDGEVAKMIDAFGAENSLKKEGFQNQRMLGIFNYAIDQKIKQLNSSRAFYERIGEVDEANLLRDEINDLTAIKNDVQERIFKTLRDGGQTAVLTQVKNGYMNRTGSDVHLYKINTRGKSMSYEFVKVLHDGDRAPGWATKGGFVAFNNPIEIEPIRNNREAIEGHAMHLATDDYYGNIIRTGDMQSDERISRVRTMIQMAKAELRAINSDTFGGIERSPAMRNDMYENRDAYISIVMDRLLSQLDDSRYEVLGKDNIVKMLLSPRAVPNKVINDSGRKINAFKNDNQFTMALMKHLNNNKTEYPDLFESMETVMRDYSDRIVIANGYIPEGKGLSSESMTIRAHEYLGANGNEATSMMKSLARMSNDSILIRNAMRRFLPTNTYERLDGTITPNKFNEFNKNDKGCSVL